MWACFALMKSDLIGCSLSVGLGFFILEKLAIAAAAEVLDDKEEEDLEQKKFMSSSDHVTSTTPYVSRARFFFFLDTLGDIFTLKLLRLNSMMSGEKMNVILG